MCDVLLPPGVNPTALNIYIISCHLYLSVVNFRSVSTAYKIISLVMFCCFFHLYLLALYLVPTKHKHYDKESERHSHSQKNKYVTSSGISFKPYIQYYIHMNSRLKCMD
jgi:hypothetical protein